MSNGGRLFRALLNSPDLKLDKIIVNAWRYVDPSSDTITMVFQCIMALITAITLSYILYRTTPLLFDLRRLMKRLEAVVPDGTIKVHQLPAIEREIRASRFFYESWMEFRESLVIAKDPAAEVRNTVDAHHFFDPDAFIYKRINVPFTNWLPALLPGLGILGTFVGILVGFHGLNTETSDQLSKSITALVAGMQMAFKTSVWGLSFALPFAFLEKSHMGQARKTISQLEHWFDRRFRRTTETQLLTEILLQQEQATGALKTFGTDLATSLQKAFTEAFNNTMGASFEGLVTSVTKMGDLVSGNQMDNMDKLVGSTMDKLNQLLQGQLDGLANTIRELMDWQKGTKAQLEALIAQLGTIGGSYHQLQDGLQASISHFNAFSQECAGLQGLFKSQSNEISDLLNRFHEVNGNVKEATSLQKTNIDAMAEAVKSLDEAQKNFMISWAAYKKDFADTNTALKDNLGVYVDQTRKAVETFGGVLDEQTAKALTRLGQTVQALSELLEALPDDVRKAIDQNGRAQRQAVEQARPT